MSDSKVSLAYIENVRTTPADMLGLLVGDVLRQTVERLHPACAADLFAIAEVKLPVGLAEDVRNWALRATADISDMPDGESRKVFLSMVSEIPAGRVPTKMRDAVMALRPHASGDSIAFLETLAEAWAQTPPDVLVLPAKRASTKVVATTAAGDVIKKVAGAKRTTTPKTPAALVDPNRGLWVREDVVTRLQPYERGLKESILVSTTVHRSPYKDMTDAEVKTELRKLERERKLKHTGDRWMMR